MSIVEKTQARAPSQAPATAADFDRFRLRHFVEGLAQHDELETVDNAVDLADVADDPRRQSESRAVPRGRAGAAGAGRQRHRQPDAARACVRRRARRAAGGRPAPAAPQARDRRGAARGSAGAGGRAHRRRRRPHHAAGASRTRRRRRPLYLGLDRLRRRSEDRLDQCGRAPADAARPARDRHRPRVAERSARDLRGDRRRRQAAAGQLRGRLASDRPRRRA